jgi:two-component sensor histidine kinase
MYWHLVEEFRLIEDRIKSMALVHEMLYQSTDLASIDLADYIEDLSKLLLGNYSSSACKIDFQLDLEPTIVSIEEAIPCGLILNELITNSLIHGFPGRIKGRIAVSPTSREDRAVRLTVLDDGIGIPLNDVMSSTKGIGLKTVNVLAAQLGGEIQYESNSGSTWILSFVRASHGNVNNLKQVNLLGNYKQASSITVNSCP